MPWSAGKSNDSHLYEVFVDGKRQPLCIRADISKGWADSYKTDDAGNIEYDGLFGRAKVVRRWGAIEIRRCNIPPFTPIKRATRQN